MCSILAPAFMGFAVLDVSVAKGCKSAHVLSLLQNPSQNDLLGGKAVSTEADK